MRLDWRHQLMRVRAVENGHVASQKAHRRCPFQDLALLVHNAGVELHELVGRGRFIPPELPGNHELGRGIALADLSAVETDDEGVTFPQLQRRNTSMK